LATVPDAQGEQEGDYHFTHVSAADSTPAVDWSLLGETTQQAFFSLNTPASRKKHCYLDCTRPLPDEVVSDGLQLRIKCGAKKAVISQRGVCKFYLLGVCRSGTECKYTHNSGISSTVPVVQEEQEGGLGTENRINVIGTTKVLFGSSALVISVNTGAVRSSRRVVLNGLTGTVTDAAVVGQMSAFGTVEHFVRPAETYAFVVYSCRSEAEQCAIKLGGRPLSRRKCVDIKLLPEPGGVATMNAFAVKKVAHFLGNARVLFWGGTYVR